MLRKKSSVRRIITLWEFDIPGIEFRIKAIEKKNRIDALMDTSTYSCLGTMCASQLSRIPSTPFGIVRKHSIEGCCALISARSRRN